jgi:hypothetical protein
VWREEQVVVNAKDAKGVRVQRVVELLVLPCPWPAFSSGAAACEADDGYNAYDESDSDAHNKPRRTATS